MASRTISAVISLPLLILIVWIGPPWFSILAAAAVAVGAYELSEMARRWGDHPLPIIAVTLSVALIALAHFLSVASFASTNFQPIVTAGAAIAILWLVLKRQPGGAFAKWATTPAIALYAGGLLFHAPLLRGLDQGREWVLFLLLVTFATDAGAFFVGKAIGKTSLAPSISPSKTWEGAVGGVLVAIGASMGVIYALPLDVVLWYAILLGALMGIVGQVGDLVESRLKRIAGVKDSGRFLPGHGGLLDRLDSIVFNLVVVYYLVI